MTVRNTPYICKMTDTDGTLLYRMEGDRLLPAVYLRLMDAVGDYSHLYLEDGSSYSGACQLQMLVDRYEKPGSDVPEVSENQDITLTTASKASDDGYPFRGRANTASIVRGEEDEHSLLTVKGGLLTLTDIVLDGGAVYNESGQNTGVDTSADGGAVHVLSNGSLTVTDGAVLRNSQTTGNGGAVYAERGSTVTLTGSPSVTGNSALKTEESAEGKGNGAGIYLEEGAVLKLSGNPDFGGTGTSDSEGTDPSASISGPAIVSGSVHNGNYSASASLPKADGAETASNGQKVYKTARQDIYIAGYGEVDRISTSIVITGEMTCAPGSIWIWAGEQEHYRMLTQFAILDDALLTADKTAVDEEKITAEQLETIYHAFRNGRSDVESECGGDYLTGQSGDIIGNVYWTGGYDISFLKIDGFGEPLDGAEFALYTAYTSAEENTPYLKGGKEMTAVSSDGKDITKFPDPEDNTKPQAKGTVLFNKIAPKTYYMVETDAPAGYGKDEETIYRLTVDPDGTAKMERKLLSEEDTAYTEAYKVRTKAAAGDEPAEYQYQIMNPSEAERKVILRKAAQTTYMSLAGATFRIFRADLLEVKNSEYAEDTGYTSGTSSVYFIDKLPEGKYYLVETEVPAGAAAANKGKIFTLEVKDGMVKELPGNDTDQIEAGTDLLKNLQTWVWDQMIRSSSESD